MNVVIHYDGSDSTMTHIVVRVAPMALFATREAAEAYAREWSDSYHNPLIVAELARATDAPDKGEK